MGRVPFGDLMVFNGFDGVGGGGVGLERGDLVKGGTKGEVAAEVKAAMALKSHCEAERRRRERINSHLTTLRGIVPTKVKLDKAALLAEVISQVKELKSNAAEVSRKCTLPSDKDEILVEVCEDGTSGGTRLIRASICCVDRPELLGDLKRTIRSLQLKILHAEISFLEGRVKNVFVMTCEDGNNNKSIDLDLVKSSIQQALGSVLERVSSQAEFSPRALLSGKRPRMSPFETSFSFS